MLHPQTDRVIDMETTSICPECGAVYPAGQTCQDYFYQMLYWENENPLNGEVHHLAVLGYYLQHPSQYSPDGLKYSMNLLRDFVERGLSTEEARRQNRDQVRSDRRTWKIKGRQGDQGAYHYPIQWPVNAGDVVAGGESQYRASVQKWAESILQTIQQTGNFLERD